MSYIEIKDLMFNYNVLKGLYRKGARGKGFQFNFKPGYTIVIGDENMHDLIHITEENEVHFDASLQSRDFADFPLIFALLDNKTIMYKDDGVRFTLRDFKLYCFNSAGEHIDTMFYKDPIKYYIGAPLGARTRAIQTIEAG